MGVYINVDMPKSCGNCFFDTHCDNWRLRNWGAPPPDDCPLVPVPPHGDLIDRDALMRHKGDCYDANGHLLYAVGTGNILFAPTIIEAEEGET